MRWDLLCTRPNFAGGRSRPNRALVSGRAVCAKPVECLFEAAQASVEAGEVCLVHDEVELHLVPGQTSLAATATPIAAKRARPIFAPTIFDS